MRNRVSQLVGALRDRTVTVMNALQHHALAHMLATWRRRDARRHGEGRELADPRSLVDASRAPVRSPLENLR